MHQSYSNLLWMRIWVRLTSDWLHLSSLKKENLYFICSNFYIQCADFGSRWASNVLTIKSFLHKLVSFSKYVMFLNQPCGLSGGWWQNCPIKSEWCQWKFNIFVRKLTQAACRLVDILRGNCWTEMSRKDICKQERKMRKKTQVYLHLLQLLLSSLKMLHICEN